jgi:arylformamidase
MRPAFHDVLAISLVVALASGCSRQGRSDPSPRIPRKVIDLSTTITPDLPVRFWGHKALSDFGFSDTTEFRIIQRDKPLYVSNSYWTLFNHGGTHADAPNHLDRDAKGIDATPLESLVGPIRVLDFRSHAKDKPIELSEIKTMTVHPGEIVILFVGYKPPSKPDEIPSFGYLSKEAAGYLAAVPVKAFGTDGLSVDSFQRIYDLMAQKAEGYPTFAPVHAAFLPRGIPVIEGLVNVEPLLGESNAIFVGFPLKVRDGDGSPIRAAALVY